MTINGLRQRFVVLKNDRKKPGTSQPDYVLLSADAPEVDAYRAAHERSGRRRQAGVVARRAALGGVGCARIPTDTTAHDALIAAEIVLTVDGLSQPQRTRRAARFDAIGTRT